MRFLVWYYFEMVKAIGAEWEKRLLYNLNYFSVPDLLKTLFSPWHKYYSPYRRFFEVWENFQSLVFNSTSRILGAIVRIFLILAGIISEIFIFLAGLAVILVWIFFPPLLIFGAIKYFYVCKLKNAAGKAVKKAIKAANSPEVKTAHLLYWVIVLNPEFNFIFNRLLINKKDFLEKLKKEIKSFPVLRGGEKKVSEDFEFIAKTASTPGEILSALAKKDRFFKEYLMANSLKAEDIENLVLWIEEMKKKRVKIKGSLAKAWSSGYTITLDKYSIDLTEQIKNKNFIFVGHGEELESLERILSVKGVNNVLLVGKAGTGRKSIIHHLAKECLTGESLNPIDFKRVVELNLPELLARIESTEEIEVILDKIFQEVASAGNIILIIDNLENYIGQAKAPGILDISGILGPYLRLSEFRAVGITTYEGLRKMERNSSVLSLFQKVEVREISRLETLCLLEYQALTLEGQYGIFISYPALRDIVSLSERYFPALAFPEKAIDLLKESAVYLSSLRNGEKILLPKHINKIVSQKAEIPVGEIEQKEKDILLHLEDLIHQRIVNQEEAVKEVSTALRRARSEITVRNGPMGVFLFLGPTGVGKTETSKALAEIYFGSESKIIRMDMNEFQSSNDIPRLIGTSFEEGLLTDAVRENPFSLVLLDEIEKAHPNILNLFLQVFDEGYLTDGMGRKIDFKNTIIISTSNAGAEMIVKALESNEKWEGVRQKMTDYLFEERIFRPELLNRFDAVVLFTPLSKQNLMDIADLLLKKLQKNLYDKGVELNITEELKEKIVDLGYNPIFGARQMRRVVQEKVENPLASALLDGRLERGIKIEINPSNFELITK